MSEDDRQGKTMGFAQLVAEQLSLQTRLNFDLLLTLSKIADGVALDHHTVSHVAGLLSKQIEAMIAIHRAAEEFGREP